VVGNDIEQLKAKPAPDIYLFAAKKLGCQHCVVVEDSIIGTEAGFNASFHVIAVATGGTDYQSTHQIYSAFSTLSLDMQFGDVTKNDWLELGKFVGTKIRQFDIH
jgi:beta-phosphoglucomutase-like phosphatase (HAD superfamily)